MQRNCEQVHEPKMADTGKTESTGTRAPILPGMPDADHQHLHLNLPAQLIARLRQRN